MYFLLDCNCNIILDISQTGKGQAQTNRCLFTQDYKIIELGKHITYSS